MTVKAGKKARRVFRKVIITLLSGFRQRDGGSKKINHPLFHDEFQIVVLGLNKGEPGERAEQDKSEH